MLYRANHETHDKKREKNDADLCTAKPPVFSPCSDLPRHPRSTAKLPPDQ